MTKFLTPILKAAADTISGCFRIYIGLSLYGKPIVFPGEAMLKMRTVKSELAERTRFELLLLEPQAISKMSLV